MHTNEFDSVELQTTRRSSYYDLDNLTRSRPTHKGFSILSTNIPKFNELEAFVEDLGKHNFKFSAICLQETWLSDNDDLCIFSLPGYDCLSQGKHCSDEGGLIIYVGTKHTTEIKLNINMHESWEGLIVRIKGGGLAKTLTLGNTYRPPRSSNYAFIEFSHIIIYHR